MEDLSKQEKKTVRELIERGLNRDFMDGIISAKKLCDTYIQGKSDPREYYHKLFSVLHSKDKDIARRYDGIKGSQYLIRLGNLFRESILTQDDFQDIDEKLKKKLSPYM
jgi:hypothetical protein